MADNDELSDLAASLTALDSHVRVEAFRAIYQGRAPSASELAGQLGVKEEAVEEAIGRLLDRGLATVDADGRVSGSHGLSLSPTDHRVRFDVGERFVWCAFDAVGIPAALAVDAQVHSRCFHCGDAVGLTIRTGEPQGVAADSLRISVTIPGSSGKVNEEVCPAINFFCSPQHAEAWATAVGGAFIDLRRAAELGRRQWADVS